MGFQSTSTAFMASMLKPLHHNLVKLHLLNVQSALPRSVLLLFYCISVAHKIALFCETIFIIRN